MRPPKTSGTTSGGRLVAGLLAVALVATACGKSKSTSGATTTAPGGSKQAALAPATLTESGSTFQKPFLEEVAKAFKADQPAVTVNLAGGGSGQGRQALSDGVVDLAAADGLPKAEDVPKFKKGPLLYFPTVAAPITISYNLAGVDHLKLDADTVARIFQRQLKTWDDAAIKALNPGAKLPPTPIVVVHRSDASGTTENFTKYLKAAAPGTWTLDAGSTVQWATDTQAGNGNPGVAQIVKGSAGGIGYVDFSDAKALQLKMADLKNKAGSFVAPSLAGTSAALDNVALKPDLSYSPLDADGPAAYPIATPTWIIVYKNQEDGAKGAAIRGLLQFVYDKGQAIAATVDYARLSDPILQAAKAQVDQIVVP